MKRYNKTMPNKRLIYAIYKTIVKATKREIYIYEPKGQGFKSLRAYHEKAAIF